MTDTKFYVIMAGLNGVIFIILFYLVLYTPVKYQPIKYKVFYEYNVCNGDTIPVDTVYQQVK